MIFFGQTCFSGDLAETLLQGLKGKETVKCARIDNRAPSVDWNELFSNRNEDLKRLEPAVREEERLMLQAVQILDRDSAHYWASTFISEKPFHCPLKHQREWVDAIISGAERNHLPICKEIIILSASLIAMESGFRVDPLAVDPSRGEDISALLQRAELEFQQKYGTYLAIPPVNLLYEGYKQKYLPRLLECKTEGQVEKIARSIAAELKSDSKHLPNAAKTIIDRELDKLINVVKTKGSMQLNFPRAKAVMKERGEEFTDDELTDYMYTLYGGVDVGIAALKPMFVQYAARYASPGSLSWLFFVGMDYHYGPFSSRNMMEQVRIRDLSGKKLPIDGDFLRYTDKTDPDISDSLTLLAAAGALPDIPKDLIIRSFLLEKQPEYIYTDVHREIAGKHRRLYGETPFAVIGELRMGSNAVVKHGVTWKTRSYLNKLDKYLNSAPWD